MNKGDAEYHVSRIVAGTQRVKIKDVSNESIVILVKTPSTYHKYLASELYRECLSEAYNEELYSKDELDDFLIDNNLWSVFEDELIDKHEKEVENLKVQMYENVFNEKAVEKGRKYLVLNKEELNRLLTKKNTFFHLSAEGYAEIEKSKFLLAMSLYYPNGKQFINEDDYWQLPEFVTEQAINSCNLNRLTEKEYRWLCRNDPWRTIWLARKSEHQVFGIPTVDLNDEQKTMLIWSSIYDNISEHPESPNDDIIGDDDLLDGWMIIQRRKRENSVNKNQVDSIIKNDKIRNSGEIFVPVNSRKAMQKINSMNDAQAQVSKRVRMNHLSKHGIVNEMNMPDSEQEIRMQIAKNAAGRKKQGV